MQYARIAIVAICLAVGFFASRGIAGPASSVPGGGVSAERREAGFTYGASVSAYDRQLIEAAIAGADPLAQRLIAEIDGITTLEIGTPSNGAAGVASGTASAFTVTLDLPMVSGRLGPRGVNRLVLHELGHVVGFVLVPEQMAAELDRGVPRCLAGAQPGCDDPAERFAESFAKWAMHDIGVNLYIGYAVPPPGDLDTWAAPLAELVE